MTDCTQWKTALSTRAMDEEKLRYFRECGIEAVELSLPWQDAESIDWEAYRRNADAAGMEIWSFHLPFSREITIATPDKEQRQKTLELHRKLIRGATAVGIKNFVLHPSTEPIADEDRPLYMEIAKRSLKEQAEFAAQYGATLCVEDLPRTCLGHTADELVELVSVDDRLKVCFDVNHLLTVYGSTHVEFVEKLGSRIATTHMSDYDFLDERHVFPGRGLIDWKTVVEALEAADYSGPFLYEGGFSVSARMPDAEPGKFEEAHDRHMRIKELRGNAV